MGTATVAHVLLCVVAIVLSGYAYYVEYEKAQDDSFEALCDISPGSSCSVVFTSRYGRGMGIIGPLLGDSHPLNLPNSVCGLFHFSLLLILGLIPRLHWLVLLLETASFLANIYLAYLLFFVLQDFCLLCTCLYVTNCALLAVGLYRWSQYYTPHKVKRTKTD